MYRFLTTLAALLVAAPAFGQAPPVCADGICVSKADLAAFIQLAKERKCLDTTKPAYQVDPLTIVTDRDGRVYFSGAQPHPWKLKMTWCNYQVSAEGHLDVAVAMEVPPDYGFRFRPKAWLGYLLADAIKDPASGIDGGLALDFLYWKFLNLDALVGVRSVGAGIGVDLTKNFGLTLGYAITWGKWESNPNAALWFAF
jgi:hypothetical protein